jgi:hypothetical protein
MAEDKPQAGDGKGKPTGGPGWPGRRASQQVQIEAAAETARADEKERRKSQRVAAVPAPSSSPSAPRSTDKHRPVARQRQQPRRDRRGKPDFWLKTVGVSAALAWIVAAVSCSVFWIARPEQTWAPAAWGDVPLRTTWNENLRLVSITLTAATLALCVVGLAINSRRMKREGDRWNRSLILLAVAALGGLLYFATV